jgi:predicted O-methyltransferase YrrM
VRKISTLLKYIAHLLQAKGRHGIHSPFVYHFVTEILHDKHFYDEYVVVDQEVKKFRRSKKIVEISDFGASAGSRNFITRFRRVRDIVKNSGIPKSTGRLLFRMVRHYKPGYILELGTSLGISTMYMSMGNPAAKIITIEGCANTAEIAQKSFDRHDLSGIELHVGEFGNILDNALKQMPRLDFVLIDGNHRKEPTLRYFNTCLAKAHQGTIMIFDDIYWSGGMEQAWKQIKAHPRVTVSIDLFRIGIVFFRKELSKQDFVLR